MSIYAKRIDESIITPKDDRILFDAIFDNYGLIYGGSAKMSAVNKINVGAARGFIKGTEIIVEEEDIAVELSDSGTKSGRLKIIVDYTNTENPVAFTSEVATSLPALEQDDLINYTNGVYEVAYATYTASETSISDVKLVMPTLETVKEKLKRLNTDLSSKANAADLAAKASAADLNAEKNTRASVDASLQSQINDTKSVASFAFGTIISTVAEFSDGYLNKKDGVVYFSFEFKIINITNGVTTNIASIPYKPYGICHCSAPLYNGNTSFPVFTAINDGIIQVHLPSDCVLSSNKENNKLRFSGSFPAKN